VSDPLASLRALGVNGWLVGGAVRDRVLDRHTSDYDVVLHGAGRPVARALARAIRGHSFKLSEGFGAWRVIAPDRSWQVDLLPLLGRTIEADLGQRDLTVNAVAEPLGGGPLVDPFGGIPDIRARRLRMVSPQAFRADPLRGLRLVRLAVELEFEPEAETAAAAARSAPSLITVAPERILNELRLIIASEQAVRGLELLEALGAIDVVLPELGALRGVEQSHFHHLDVHDHTRAVLAETIALERDLAAVFGDHGAAVGELLSEPLANELTRGQALRLGALFHDIAKPQTRKVTSEGRVTFIGHDAAGADIAAVALRRLRASERLAEYVAGLTRNHLRLGFLVHEMPITRRSVYRYLKSCSPIAVDVTVLSVADRLATRGAGSERAIVMHLELSRQLIAEALAWQRDPPRPPVRGDELARITGVAPGPELGRVLAELEEASFAGEISSAQEAIDRARALVAGDG
jgi:putative nucleotidyltransferase with HDIG domain